jgi:hypothetical protein
MPDSDNDALLGDAEGYGDSVLTGGGEPAIPTRPFCLVMVMTSRDTPDNSAIAAPI